MQCVESLLDSARMQKISIAMVVLDFFFKKNTQNEQVFSFLKTFDKL